MLKSMTGYGRGYCSCDGREITIELKAVNHRYLDLSFRLPRGISFLEDSLRSCLSSSLARGHVDLYVNYRNSRPDSCEIKPDEALISQYITAFENISKLYNIPNDFSTSALVRLPDALAVIQAPEDKQKVIEIALNACNKALDELNSMRAAEGERLCADLAQRAGSLREFVEGIALRAPIVVKDYREKLNERIASILAEVEIDRARLATEIALFADKANIDEEITRLFSHISQFSGIIESEGAFGRKLDFLVQEMNREFNTIGSKANDAGLVEIVLTAKAEIEKIREQVQNIE